MTAETATGRRGWAKLALPVLVMLTVVMILVTAGILAGIMRSLSAKNDTLRELRAQQAQDAAKPVPVVSALPAPTLDLAALRTQYAKVQAADKNVDAQTTKWQQGGSRIKIIVDAIHTCVSEADRYNRAAARFSAAQLGGLPQSVDLKSATTDCGGATFRKQAEKI